MIPNAQQLYKIFHWFETYQGKNDYVTMRNLYKDLIEEESNELNLSIENKDIVWILDAIVDTMRVILGYQYFWWEDGLFDVEWSIEYISKLWFGDNAKYILAQCIDAVIVSNYSKEIDADDNWKIKKWPNYKEPAIMEVIQPYVDNFIEARKDFTS